MHADRLPPSNQVEVIRRLDVKWQDWWKRRLSLSRRGVVEGVTIPVPVLGGTVNVVCETDVESTPATVSDANPQMGFTASIHSGGQQRAAARGQFP